MKTTLRRAIACAIILGGTTVATTATSSVASASTCPTRTTHQAFAQWGDFNQYFAVPGGTFEGGATGWSLVASGHGTPSVISDQAPWRVNGSTHSRGLRLPAYTTAVAPNVCLASNEEWGRLFYRDPGVNGAALLVKIEAWSSAGRMTTEVRFNSGSAGWKVSPQIAMPNKRDSAGNQMVTITITPVNTPGTWVIDDVMIDPWIARR